MPDEKKAVDWKFLAFLMFVAVCFGVKGWALAAAFFVGVGLSTNVMNIDINRSKSSLQGLFLFCFGILLLLTGGLVLSLTVGFGELMIDIKEWIADLNVAILMVSAATLRFVLMINEIAVAPQPDNRWHLLLRKIFPGGTEEPDSYAISWGFTVGLCLFPWIVMIAWSADGLGIEFEYAVYPLVLVVGAASLAVALIGFMSSFRGRRPIGFQINPERKN